MDQEAATSNTTCVCQQYDLIWGAKVSCEFRKKVVEISKRQNFDPNDFMAVMAVETSETFSPSKIKLKKYTNAKGKKRQDYFGLTKEEIMNLPENFDGAVGLIQFTPAAIKDLNTYYKYNLTKRKLALMTQLEQLDYAEKHIAMWKKIKKITGKLTLGDLYIVVFAPDRINGSDDNTILYKKGTKEYEANESLDKDNNGITKKELATRAYEKYKIGETHKETKFSCELIANPSIQTTNSGKWHNPVDNPRLTKYNWDGNLKPSSGTYGWCRRYSNGNKKYHSGFDFFAIPAKDKVYACLKGNIHQVRWSDSAGWIVRVKIQNVKDLLEQEKEVNYKLQFTDELKGIDIKETDDVYFIYMHLNSVFFTEKDGINKTEVDVGTPLGLAGVSGSIANQGHSPHLHLEIATVLDAYGHGESVRTNPARFVKLNSYDTKDQDEESKNKHYHKK